VSCSQRSLYLQEAAWLLRESSTFQSSRRASCLLQIWGYLFHWAADRVLFPTRQPAYKLRTLSGSGSSYFWRWSLSQPTDSWCFAVTFGLVFMSATAGEALRGGILLRTWYRLLWKTGLDRLLKNSSLERGLGFGNSESARSIFRIFGFWLRK